MKPASEIIEELSKALDEDPETVRDMTVSSLQSRINKPKRDRNKNKAAKKARRNNR